MSDFPKLFSEEEIVEPINEIIYKDQSKPLSVVEEFNASKKLVADKFPRIFEKIRLLWGSEPCEKYLSELIQADRTNRQGFPLDVANALLNIHKVHVAKFGTFQEIKPWEIGFDK